MKNESQDIGTLQKGKTVTTLYLSGLNYSKTETDIKKQFERFGMVSYVRLIRDLKTNKKKGIGFVQMPSRTDAFRAIRTLHGKQWAGRTLKVEIARDNEANKTDPKKVKFNSKQVKAKDDVEADTDSFGRKKRPKRRTKGLKLLFENTRA